MGFFGYFLRRLSLVIPTLLGVTIITFTLTYVLPGNPAVVKGWVCACGVRLSDDLSCPECGIRHEETPDGLKAV